jgi:hypothetical protein
MATILERTTRKLVRMLFHEGQFLDQKHRGFPEDTENSKQEEYRFFKTIYLTDRIE